MTSSIAFKVNGIPAPQGSKTKNAYGAIYDDNKKLKPWRAAVKAAALEAIGHYQPPEWEPFAGPCYIYISFEFARTPAHYGTGRNAHILKASAPAYPVTIQGDIDKLARATFDALTDAGIWVDDKQAVDMNCVKHWARSTPGASVRVVDLARLQTHVSQRIEATA